MFIRQSVYPPLGDIRLVLAGKIATFANLASIGTTLAVRRVGNLFYSRCFANAMFRDMLLCQGRLTEATKRILVFAASNGDEMENLILTDGRLLLENRSGLFQTRHRGTHGRKPHDGIRTPGRDADHHCRLCCQDCLGNDGTGQSSSGQEESCFGGVLRNRS